MLTRDISCGSDMPCGAQKDLYHIASERSDDISHLSADENISHLQSKYLAKENEQE